MQGVEVASQIGSSLPHVKISSFIGGLPVSEDRVKAQCCHLAVGTPGRLKQIIDEGILNPDTVRLVILDEADKLLEPSFLKDTTHILNLLPQNKQVLALSATYPEELSNLAEKFMRSPQHVRLGKENQVLHGVAQFVLELEQSPSKPRQNQIKQEALLKILSSIPYNQCLVFSNFQVIAQSTADFLNSRGFPSIFISAGQDQIRRIQAIQTFKTFKCRILCSTDLTARGIDAENVNLVINLDVPDDHNTYLHRIGLLPILKGLSETELQEAAEESKSEKSSREVKLSEDPDQSHTEKSPKPKTGNKIKRRGKKHSSSPAVDSADLKEESGVTKPDYVKLLDTMLTGPVDPTISLKNYTELQNIARNLGSSSLLRPESRSPGLSLEAKKKVVNHFSEVVQCRTDRVNEQISKCKTNLNYRSVTDILQQVQTDWKPETLNVVSGSESNSSECSSSESADSTSESSDSDSISSDDDEINPAFKPNPTFPPNLGVNLPSVNLTPEQDSYLRSWMQTVERQRQIIQSREYWRVFEHYQRRN